MVNLQTEIAGICLSNPFFLASGTCGYGRELAEFFDLNLSCPNVTDIVEIAAAVEQAGADAVEFMMAGAFAVAIGSASLVNPYAVLDILREFTMWMDEHGYTHVKDIVGLASSIFTRLPLSQIRYNVG